MKSPTKMKRVKAYALLKSDGSIRDIYLEKKNLEYEKRHTPWAFMDGYKVVPITITYNPNE